MLPRLLWKSLRGRRSRVALAGGALAVAAALAAALLSVALDISEKVARELRAFGANITVVPRQESLEVEIGGLRYAAAAQAAYLAEVDLPKLKTIFWGHNIQGFAPFLSAPVEAGGRQVLLVGTWFDREVVLPQGPRKFSFSSGNVREPESEGSRFRTGLRAIAPWWRVRGRWVEDLPGDAMVGKAVAARLGVAPGDRVPVRASGTERTFRVTGLIETGGPEEDQLFVDLAAAQALLGLPGKVDRVQVSALVKPDDVLAMRGRRNPQGLPPEEYERWYCSPYIDAITYQIEEAIPRARAKAVRQVAEAEGAFLGRLTLTLVLVSAIAIATAGLGVMATMTTTVMERRREIGLMKAIGAEPRQIARQFLLEAALCGVAGGGLGTVIGLLLAKFIGRQVFQVPIAPSPIVVPFVLALAVLVALLGAALPTWRAARLEPATTLKGD
ncbi:MAG: ABC transporter permease [candidate division NC10 bacterium]|nr:ABC transporter permease [candidate division NC10 bacterium]